MKKRESSFSLRFRHWIFANAKDLPTAAFEIKQTTTNSIPFSCVEQHQLDQAEAVRYGKKGSLIRVESGTIGAADYIFLKNTYSFIVIKFPLGFVIIDTECFLIEKTKSVRKSLTWEKASSIAWKVVKLSCPKDEK